MDETVNNIEGITSYFVIIEYYNNKKKNGGLVRGMRAVDGKLLSNL